MSTQENVEIVKNFLAALDRRDKQGLLASIAEFRSIHREAVTAAGAKLVQFAKSCGHKFPFLK
jgi:hypothetical protein